MADIRTAKSRSRTEAKLLRARAWRDATAGRAQAGRLAERGVLDLPLATARCVSAYLAMGDELDPGPLMASLDRKGIALALPVVAGKGQPLLFRSWRPGDATVAAGFGTREPHPCAALVEPDLLLVPLLAFDARGCRLGYGGGFYDRTLAQLRGRATVLAIGIAFDAQEVDAVPHLDYDEHLDGVLTPSGLRLCRG